MIFNKFDVVMTRVSIGLKEKELWGKGLAPIHKKELLIVLGSHIEYDNDNRTSYHNLLVLMSNIGQSIMLKKNVFVSHQNQERQKLMNF